MDRALSAGERFVAALARILLRWRVLPLVGLIGALVVGTLDDDASGTRLLPRNRRRHDPHLCARACRNSLEETARRFSDVQLAIRNVIPPEEVKFIAENIGAPEPINLAWVESGVIGSFDGEILIQLAQEHAPTVGYADAIRAMIKERFPTSPSISGRRTPPRRRSPAALRPPSSFASSAVTCRATPRSRAASWRTSAEFRARWT